MCVCLSYFSYTHGQHPDTQAQLHCTPAETKDTHTHASTHLCVQTHAFINTWHIHKKVACTHSSCHSWLHWFMVFELLIISWHVPSFQLDVCQKCSGCRHQINAGLLPAPLPGRITSRHAIGRGDKALRVAIPSPALQARNWLIMSANDRCPSVFG